MREVDGEANSETLIDVIERGTGDWHYRLQPVTGRKHQLRVHMAALGEPIVDDNVYQTLTTSAGVDDFSRPLNMLARRLAFRSEARREGKEWVRTSRNRWVP